MIDQRFGRGAIIQEALNDPGRVLRRGRRRKQFVTAGPARGRGHQLEDGDLIEFTAEVDVRPDFDLPDFSTLQARSTRSRSPRRWSTISCVLRNVSAPESVERPAADGDIVTITWSPAGTASRWRTRRRSIEYAIGSGQMLDGLDEAVTGLSAGESATFASTLVGGPLKDEEADIDVTVTEVQAELPEADDEFAQEASEFDTMEELRADIKRAAHPGPTRAGEPGPWGTGDPGRTARDRPAGAPDRHRGRRSQSPDY